MFGSSPTFGRQYDLSKQYLNILFSWKMEDVGMTIFIPTPPIIGIINMQCHSFPYSQFCTWPFLYNECKSPNCWMLWLLSVHMRMSSQRQSKHIPKFPPSFNRLFPSYTRMFYNWNVLLWAKFVAIVLTLSHKGTDSSVNSLTRR